MQAAKDHETMVIAPRTELGSDNNNTGDDDSTMGAADGDTTMGAAEAQVRVRVTHVHVRVACVRAPIVVQIKMRHVSMSCSL